MDAQVNDLSIQFIILFLQVPVILFTTDKHETLLKHTVSPEQIRPGKAGAAAHTALGTAESPDSNLAEPGEPLETWDVLWRSRGQSREKES